MLDQQSVKNLEKQKYRFAGSHSAVKTCGWTKKMIKGEGGCYKLKFYGIMSNQCMQMTTSMFCANRCVFCWRGTKAPVSKDWYGKVDDPELILNESLEKHNDLLIGMKGNKSVSDFAYKQSKDIKHVALSLTGEPITYPKINELIRKFHERKISTFLVTNAQYPEQIKNLEPITQLYISMDAPNKDLLKEIDKPLFPDFWERFIESLDSLKDKNQRTCIRLTLIKGKNMVLPEKYAELIKRADPDFLEVKAYMFVGASRQVLSMENMPYHEEVVEFTKVLLKFLPEYSLVSEHVPSRVVCLAKKKYYKGGRWHTWINFPKFFELLGSEFTTEDFLLPTPSAFNDVNEKTKELDMWN